MASCVYIDFKPNVQIHVYYILYHHDHHHHHLIDTYYYRCAMTMARPSALGRTPRPHLGLQEDGCWTQRLNPEGTSKPRHLQGWELLGVDKMMDSLW